MIEAEGVDVRLGGRFAVELRHLRVGGGDRVAVVGRSGTGKSTILHLLAGLLAPATAERLVVRPNGIGAIDLAALWQEGRHGELRRYRARSVGFVLQSGGLAPFLTVRENVALPTALRADVADVRVDELLDKLGIGHLATSKPDRISVGERQRVAIARALVNRPAVVLADEPTSSLDPDTADVVMDLLTAAIRDDAATLLMVTHDAQLAEDHGIRLIRCRTTPTPHRSCLDDRRDVPCAGC
ncbi:MAG: ATP-binding cassette domain-containing protein [Pseudomonadota bacterium]